MSRRMIYLDIDNTLIASVQRFIDEKVIAFRYGIPMKEYARLVDLCFETFGKGGFGFTELFKILRDHYPKLPDSFFRELRRVVDQTYFFYDTLPFLSRFPREELAIITEGGGGFQWPKIRAHGFRDLVSCIIITSGRSKAEMMYFHDRTPKFFLDDAPRVLDQVKMAHPEVICIQMHGVPPWEVQQNSLYADAYFNSLTEAADYIESQS